MRRFGPLQVLEMYGLTEGSVATFNYTGQLGAVGRASWLYKVKGAGSRRPRGQEGREPPVTVPGLPSPSMSSPSL